MTFKTVLRLFSVLAFPVLVTIAWIIFDWASFGDVVISSQLTVLTLIIQKYFWTEKDFHEFSRCFLFKRRE